MRCFTWKSGEIHAGLTLTADEKLGQVLFLGEQGRGRRYEKVSLARRNPAEVVSGRVHEAHPLKITLPARDGMKEKSFYVLEKSRPPMGLVLVRVNTYGGYIRGGQGGWQVIAGQPEVLVSGYGAFGDAGRIGNWDDGIIVLREGDVLRITESRSEGVRWALWVKDGQPVTATWQDWENLQAVAKAEAVIAEAAAKPEGIPVLFGRMPAFTFFHGVVEPGIKVEVGAAGPAIKMGENGRGRKLVEVPLVGLAATDRVASAAVANLGKGIIGLVESEKPEPGAILVRVSTAGGYTRRGDGLWETWKGSPTLLTSGNGADGAAGGIGTWADGLFVLREGDVLFVRPAGSGSGYALWVAGGEPKIKEWQAWKIEDAKATPDFYVAKGVAPFGHVPAEWVGRVVTVRRFERASYRDEYQLEDGHCGEVVSTKPLVLNFGWDGRDREDVTINSGVWVRLDTDKVVTRLAAPAVKERDQARAEVASLRAAAQEICRAGYFTCLADDLREKLFCRVAGGKESWGDDSINFLLATTEEICSWVAFAKDVLSKANEARPAAEELHRRVLGGEVLVVFGGSYRWAATGNQDFWVVAADGSLREPDVHTTRSRGRGEDAKRWHLVGPGELALTWTKQYTAAPHEFAVAKVPLGGVTPAQVEAVKRIEDEIRKQFDASTGMTGRPSPLVGNGWGLGSTPAPTEPTASAVDVVVDKTPLSADGIAEMRDALAKKFGGRR